MRRQWHAPKAGKRGRCVHMLAVAEANAAVKWQESRGSGRQLPVEQVLRYERRGWLLTRSLLSPKHVLEIRGELENVVAASMLAALQQRVRVLCPQVKQPPNSVAAARNAQAAAAAGHRCAGLPAILQQLAQMCGRGPPHPQPCACRHSRSASWRVACAPLPGWSSEHQGRHGTKVRVGQLSLVLVLINTGAARCIRGRCRTACS